jgi:magnesium transporter
MANESTGNATPTTTPETASATAPETAATAADPTPTDVLARTLAERYPFEAARLIEGARVHHAAAYLESLPENVAVDVLRRVNAYMGTRLMDAVEPQTAARFLELLTPHRAAALVSRLSPARVDRILQHSDPQYGAELKALASYPSNTAGSLMDPRVNSFAGETRTRDVIRQLRTLRQKRIQDVFVVDEDERLQGAVALQDVVLADGSTPLASLVQGPPPSVEVTASRASVLEELQKSRASSLPVVDFEGRVLGVLRQSELLAVTQQKAADGLVTMVGASKDERALSSPLFAVRKRLPWLQINLLTAFLAASVVGLFEGTIARFTALAVLLPVVAGQSGNTGAQALAVTMRGLTLREVRVRQWLRVVIKEMLVGSVNGLAVATTTCAAVFIWSRSLGLTLVIGVSMVLSMIIAGMAGAAIPVILTSLRQDPAQSSSIILTTITDVAGFFSFLGIATLLSHML